MLSLLKRNKEYLIVDGIPENSKIVGYEGKPKGYETWEYIKSFKNTDEILDYLIGQ